MSPRYDKLDGHKLLFISILVSASLFVVVPFVSTVCTSPHNHAHFCLLISLPPSLLHYLSLPIFPLFRSGGRVSCGLLSECSRAQSTLEPTLSSCGYGETKSILSCKPYTVSIPVFIPLYPVFIWFYFILFHLIFICSFIWCGSSFVTPGAGSFAWEITVLAVFDFGYTFRSRSASCHLQQESQRLY